MSTAAPLQHAAVKPQQSSHGGHGRLLLQRQCACGSPTSSLTGVCSECKSKKPMQAKLTIAGSNDPLEQEADRVADQVLATPLNSTVSGALPRIQRFTGQTSGETGTAPASVERVLAGSGEPLQPTLRQDMEQRLGYDFSQVRIHFGNAAAQSAREVNANAYTVGPNIVFGTGQFAPGRPEGRRLIAHELTHVLQQSGSDKNHADGSNINTGTTALRGRNADPRFQRQATSIINPVTLFRQIVRENPFGSSDPANTSPVSAESQHVKPGSKLVRENPFIASSSVPDLPDSAVKAVRAAIAAQEFQRAIEIILAELALGTLGPVIVDRSLLEGRTMTFDASLKWEGRTDNPLKDREGNPLPMKVRLGPLAFRSSPSWLYSTMLHEYSHVLQAQSTAKAVHPRLGTLNVRGSDPLGHGQEVEAYALEILNATATGLRANPAHIEEVWRRLRNDHWRLLMPVLKRSLTSLVDRAFAAAVSVVGSGKLMSP